jgi:tRNA(Arg) A34 adenosine deaminase TadA
MIDNPNNIPKKKFDRLLELSNIAAGKRTPTEVYNHAAFILTKQFNIVSYGENNRRKISQNMTTHAEIQALQNIKHSKIKNNSYYLFVIKASPKIGKLGNSSCCAKCTLKILESNIKISRVYYSIENGISYYATSNIPIYITVRDRDKYNDDESKIEKISNRIIHLKRYHT